MRKARFPLPAFVLLLVFAGCATVDGNQYNALTTEDEIALGEEVAKQVEEKEKVLDDPALQAYVAGIGQRLARLSPRQDVEYRFQVIDNIETVNAFALPGGRMYIYTGLMKLCGNEGELAAVMAHEISHVASHHHGESMTRQQLGNAVAAILLGKDPSALAEVGATLVGTGVFAKFSRQNEREADSMGMKILFQAGYTPDAMLSFMDKMMQEEQRKGGGHPLPIFSSHPATANRLLYLQELAAQYPEDMRRNSPVHAGRYKTNVLDKLPDAPTTE